MGATRIEPDDAKFKARQRYYRKHKQDILAKAKVRYAAERDLRCEIAQKVRKEVQARRLKEDSASKGLFGQWIQQFKSKLGGSAKGVGENSE